jgi:hypothetical protein
MKKCKGTGKASGYGCGVELPYSERNGLRSYKAKYGLGLDCGCYTNWLISDNPKAKEAFNSFLISNKKKVEKDLKRIEKERRLDIVDWKPKLQVKINFIVRLIDIGLPCLARNYHPGQIHAGHIYARGGNQYIKYNLHNIHRQSAQSNGKQNDDGLLREGLINEYGQEYMDFISQLRQTPKLEYMNHEYREFTKHASSIANELKRQGKIFPTTQERIYMRNEINNQLGIYDQKYCEFKL